VRWRTVTREPPLCLLGNVEPQRLPRYGEPAIVTAVLPAPVYDPDEASSASPYFQEPLSIVVGVHRDDDFLEFRVDGRRFEPIDG